MIRCTCSDSIGRSFSGGLLDLALPASLPEQALLRAGVVQLSYGSFARCWAL
jgi:hypothetical protein